jgi:hypothetical protein
MTQAEQPIETISPTDPVQDEPLLPPTVSTTEDQLSPSDEPDDEQIPIPGKDESVGSEQPMQPPVSSSAQNNTGSKGQDGKKKRYYRPPYRNKNKNNNVGMPPKPPSRPLPS